jgi:hypothetical protein
MTYKLNILVVGWKRPELLENVLDKIGNFPSNIFIWIDGETLNDPGVNEKVKKCQSIAIQYKLNNPNTVIQLNPKNLGCRDSVNGALNWFFSLVPEGAILEDDMDFNTEFLTYMSICLNKFRDVPRIYHINGFCPLPEIDSPMNFYQSKFIHVWGWGTWSNRWQQNVYVGTKNHPVDFDFDTFTNLETLQLSPFTSIEFANHLTKQIELTLKKQIDTWDFLWVLSIWQNGGWAISPPFNFIKNQGFGPNATHTFEYPNQNWAISSLNSYFVNRMKSDNHLEPIVNIYIDKVHEMIDYIEFKSSNIPEQPNKIGEIRTLKNIYRALIPLRIRRKLYLSRFFKREKFF